jgi:hypothetical protein
MPVRVPVRVSVLVIMPSAMPVRMPAIMPVGVRARVDMPAPVFLPVPACHIVSSPT